MLSQNGAKQIAGVIQSELSGSAIAAPKLLKPRLQGFLIDLTELMQYEELKPSSKEHSRRSLEKLKDLANQLSLALADPVPELYGALLEQVPTRMSDGKPIEDMIANLEVLQRAASTALLDAYRQNRTDRAAPIARFLSYRIAVLMDSHFGEGTATNIRGRMFDKVLRVVLSECGIQPPTDLANHVMPQALRILRLDQSSLKPIKTGNPTS